MAVNINYQPNEPDLIDVLNYFGRDLKLNFNCHHIGTIESFDSVMQTAKVSINYVKSFLQIDTPASVQGAQQSAGATSITNKNYPVLVSAPVMFLGGGNGALTFPVANGDECLILFNDRDMDNWWSSGASSSAPNTTRLHSFSDAIILVGLRSLPNVLTSFDSDAVAIRMGDNSVKVYEDKVQATAGDTVLELTADGKFTVTNASGELITSLVQLLTDIQNATTNTVFGPQPLIMPTFPTDLAVLESFKA